MKFSTIPNIDYGKMLEVTFNDNQTVTGKLIIYTAPGDSEKGLEELSIEKADKTLCGFAEDEVKSVKIIK